MDNIINEIINIDRRAQQKYIDADAYQKKAEEEIQGEIAKFDAATKQKCSAKLDAARAAQEVWYRERAKAIADGLEQKKKALEQIYNENHVKWETELFDKVLGKA